MAGHRSRWDVGKPAEVPPSEVDDVGSHESQHPRQLPHLGGQLIRQCRYREVDDRVGEEHRCRQGAGIISDPHRRGGSQVGTCTGTADGQPLRICAEVVRDAREPHPRCVDVVERDRIAHGVRGQPVVNRYDGGAPEGKICTHHMGLRHVKITGNEGVQLLREFRAGASGER